MSPSKRNVLIAATFLVPVFCCFIGIGAFIHVTLSAEEVQRHKEDQLRRETLEELAELQKELNALKEKAEAVKQQINDVQKRIQELAEKLLEAKGIGEKSEELNEDIFSLKELLAKFLVELSALQDEIAQKQKEIENLKDETENADSLSEKQKELQKQREELQQQADEAKRKYERLREKLDELRRLRDEEEKKHEIRPAKPLPAGRPKPVFIECTARAAIIQPEETQLKAHPQADDRHRFLAVAGRTGYVVFLIRPGGFQSFENYRDLVKSHNNRSGESIRFGFEPINASWQLVYPGQED